MQKSTFTDGGFVIHRITLAGMTASRISAWFTKSGELIDAELIYPGFTRPAPKTGPIRARLEAIGRTYA